MVRNGVDINQRFAAYQSLVPLLVRLGVGLTFFMSGYAKVLGGMAGTTKFFASLGIPLPGVMAPFISYLELLGGAALLIGLLTRVFALLLIGDMTVAILVAQLPRAMKAANIAQGWTNVRTEFLLLTGAAALVVAGAGLLSVDAAIRNARSRRPVESVTPATS